jgi:DNA-binding MarR family transcriptional regulator
MKQHEYRLLEAIAEDETVTQASLAHSLEMAVGSVNWYIKRLISRGYLKATRMDRTRLRYNLTNTSRIRCRSITIYANNPKISLPSCAPKASSAFTSMATTLRWIFSN